jgi:uncharacterized protein YbaR (Trm112 family)/SAM-dependent methyltransferase
MRIDLPDLLPIVCPVCRRNDDQGLNVHTLTLEHVLRQEPAGELIEGVLICRNQSCRRRFPVIDGIPIVVANLADYLSGQLGAVVEAELAPEIATLLAGAGPDGSVMAHLLEQLSIYIDAHWGDMADPPPDGPTSSSTPSFGFARLAERLQARSVFPVERAVELGASVGRGLAELAQGASLAVGVDWDFSALRRARRVLRGEALRYSRRTIGRHYQTATVRAAGLAAPGSALICADALDPPLLPETFDRVVALNLLDAVRSPLGLLQVADGLCQGGGELILASPFSWRSGVVDEEARWGGDDPAGALRRRLEGGMDLRACYAIEEQADLAWWLRCDSRNAASYSTNYVRARKPISSHARGNPLLEPVEKL